MNSWWKTGETPQPLTNEPPPLHGLRHTMLSSETLASLRTSSLVDKMNQVWAAAIRQPPFSGETLKIWATPEFVAALEREAPHILAFVQGYKPMPLTDRQERELYRASFRRLIQEPLRARRRGWCATPPLD